MEDNFAIQTLSTQENVAGVKARLRKEGREARNLIAYSLPLGSWKISFSSSTNEKDIEKLNKRSITKEKKLDNARFKQSKRHRSASAGRDPQACLRARHWGFLFRNLQQAVDEIYQTAEDDESIIECKEAILMLERYTNDFYKLIDWFKIKWEYENSSPPQRPTSLAWEIRTSSPGKAFKYDRRNIAVGDTKKALNFNQSSLSSVKPKTDVIPETCDSSSVEKVTPTIKINTRDKNSNTSSLANGSSISVQKGNYESNKSIIEEQIATKKEDNGEICFNNESGNNNSVLHENKSVNLGSYNDLNTDLIDTPNEKSIASSVIGLKTLSQTFLSQDKPSTLYANILKDDKSDNFDFTKDTVEKKSPETSLKDKMDLQVEYNSDSNKGRASIINTSTTRNKYKEQKIFTETKKADQKKHSTDYQIKQFHSKPGPLVNMNKASQVRQAFNQNKTPIKSNSVSGWKPHYTFTFSENKVLCSKQGKESSVIFEGNSSSNNSLNSGSNNPATSSSFIYGQSWADKVKGNSVGDFGEKMSSSKVLIKDDDGHDIDDNEGWEVVRRHKRNHGSAGSVNSKLSSKSTYCDEEIKVKYPHKIKNRFHHPSSAISLPSLHSSSDINERLERNSLPGNCFISQNWSVNSKESKHNVKKLHAKNKRFQKQSSDINGIRNSNCYRLCKVTSMNNHYKTTVFHRETKNKEENIDNEKLKKDAANAKTQSGSNLSSSKEKVDKFEAHLKLPSNGNVLRGEPSIDNQIKDFDAGDGSSDKTSLFPVVMNEEGLKNKVCPTLTSKTVLNKFFCPSNISESQSGNESDNEEEKLRCNAEAFECAIKREKKLKEEIEETKNAPIEICSADDEDGEAEIDSYEMFGNSAEINSQNEICNLKNDFENVSIQTGFLNWADEMDEVDKVESIRPPGRVLHIHEKLSSPSRKLPISEKLRRHKEKLAKAQELRGKLMFAKTEKLKDLFRKIDEVNIDKERLLLEKRDLFERKMERAEEKRRVHLQEIINKAHDEENKAKEIAFINGLEAQNKLHDIMQQHQSHESRMADMAEERSRKLEEKAAKEAAAQERRKVLEEERKARMLELCEKRRKRYERIDRQQAERREELLEQAREKARDREERRCALQQAQQAKESELVKKIQQKQEETARRHEENIEQIRQKALESSIMKYSRGCDEAPKLRRYETKKLCTLCNSVITSEVYLLSHLRSFQHEESLKVLNKRDISLEESETYNLKYIVDAPPNIVDSQVIKDKERLKALKKRCRKIRTRMTSRGREFLKHFNNPTSKDSVVKNRISKSLTQIGKLLSSQGTGPWLASDVSLLDKNLLELLRILEKNGDDEQKIFASLDGFRRLLVILEQILCEEETPCVIPSRSLSICARILHAATKNSNENSLFLLFSNLVGNIIDQLNRRLNEMSLEFSRNGSSSSLNSITLLPSDPVATSLMELLSQILHDAKPENNCSEVEKNDCFLRSQDVVSYCVSMGVTDKISWYFNHVQNPVENDPSSADIILSATSLLSALSEKLCERSQCGDPTQLIETFRVLDACGVVSLLYGLLLHQGGRSPTPPMASLLSASTLAISAAATTLLYRLAELDLETFQTILGSEGISLEFRHIASFLLWYCTHWPSEEILHNVIALVGFFAINNKENQCIIQSGETPSVLQQLCSLPWQYFSEPRLTDVLFPTLLACCLNNHDNLNILQQEMSFQILEDYLKNNKASKRTVMQILYSLYTI